MADIVLVFTPGQVASVNNINKTGPNETTVDVFKTFADITENDGVATIEVTISDAETRVDPVTGETNFLEKTQGDSKTTITSLRVVMNDGTVYVLKGGSPVDFREQDTANTPNSFNPSMGDTFVETNNSVQLVNEATGVDAPNSGSGSFANLSGQNLVFSNAGDWVSGVQTRAIDSSGSTADTTGDGLFNVCFLVGTLILAQHGAVPVEKLRAGDLVVTADRGVRPVLLVISSSVKWDKAAHKDKPILIGKGALGAGLPGRNLVVSPQHRVLIPARGETAGVLLPAKSLTHLPHVRQMAGKREAHYVHLLFECHEVIFAEGAPTESFYPGDMARSALNEQDRVAVEHALLQCRENATSADYPPARPLMRPGQIKRLGGLNAPVWTEARLLAAGLKQAVSRPVSGTAMPGTEIRTGKRRPVPSARVRRLDA